LNHPSTGNPSIDAALRSGAPLSTPGGTPRGCPASSEDRVRVATWNAQHPSGTRVRYANARGRAVESETVGAAFYFTYRAGAFISVRGRAKPLALDALTVERPLFGEELED